MGHSSGNSCYVTVQMLLAHLHLAWHFFISLTLFLPCFLRMQSVSIYLYCLLQTLRSQSTGHVKCLTYSPMVCLFFPCMLEGVKRHCTPFPHLLCQRLGISRVSKPSFPINSVFTHLHILHGTNHKFDIDVSEYETGSPSLYYTAHFLILDSSVDRKLWTQYNYDIGTHTSPEWAASTIHNNKSVQSNNKCLCLYLWYNSYTRLDYRHIYRFSCMHINVTLHAVFGIWGLILLLLLV